MSKSTELKQFYASCPKGVEVLLADELRALGAVNFKEHPSHLTFQGTLEVGYKACLHSRLANRIFLCLLDEQFSGVEDMYNKVNSIEWAWHYSLEDTFAVDCVARKNKDITHSGFGGLKVKDAIVDYFNERYEQRPSVDKDNPDYRVQAIINGSQLKIGLDLSGRSLHQRGYRQGSGRAPIKENLAAALLMRANWPALADQGYWFHDPMCGTGTLLIEAAMMATDFAPGLLNPHFGFEKWKEHDNDLWQQVVSKAKRAHREKLPTVQSRFIGTDSHRESLSMATENIDASEHAAFIETQYQDIEHPIIASFQHKGLVLSNPPYAERLGEEDEVSALYRTLGDYVKSRCPDWNMGIITNDMAFAKMVGLRSNKQYKFKNGALDCQLYLYHVSSENEYTPFDPTVVNKKWDHGLSEQAMMFANRLKKNQQRFKSYLKQNDISCYRLYDADLPDYSAAIDVYEQQVHLQEYAPPKDFPEKVAQRRLNEMVRVTSGVLGIPEAQIFTKQRRKQKGTEQYTKSTETDVKTVVHEQGAKFYVNLQQYLDTGLFLDHRKTRRMIMNKAKNARFLNLFSYTGSVSVYAALGGAKTTTVDMSRTYINWAMKNFALNEITVYGHNFVQQDCLQWLDDQQGSGKKHDGLQDAYDLIFLDPPTFSNSKRMDETFDVQRDQVGLITKTMNLLSADGTLYFSNNFKRFMMEEELKEQYVIHEITGKTLPMDFQKSKNHHRCWTIQHKK